MHSLALHANGTMKLWGMDANQRLNVPKHNIGQGSEKFIAISAGGYHSLALREDGQLIAWGDDIYFQSNATRQKKYPNNIPPPAQPRGCICFSCFGY